MVAPIRGRESHLANPKSVQSPHESVGSDLA